MPKTRESRTLSAKFALALQFANEIHSTQVRKGRGAPYISHLIAVSALVLEYGGDETQAIAALMHDSAEDCGGEPMLETVRVLFGDDVAAIVKGCTDTFERPKPPRGPRKEAYLRALPAKPGRTKLVVCADKLHNLSNTLRDIRTEGVRPWKARMARTADSSAREQARYYKDCFEALAKGWKHPMLDEFRTAVDEFRRLVGDT